MRVRRRSTAAFLLAAAGLLHASPPPSDDFPGGDELLRYTVNWPSGLSLGDASLYARRDGNRWVFEFTLNAAVPGFAVKDRYRSIASAGYCSLEFAKDTAHGSRVTREKTTFDYRKGVARRVTFRGGKSELPLGECARDALNFVFFARRELARGRLPCRQPVLLGAAYDVRLEYAGVRTVTVNDVVREADLVRVSSRGPASGIDFDVFFARDAARTPILVRVPLPLGALSMELAH